MFYTIPFSFDSLLNDIIEHIFIILNKNMFFVIRYKVEIFLYMKIS